MVSENPYKFTSDDIFFTVYAERNVIPNSELEKERELFFFKRTSLGNPPINNRS